MRPDIRSDLICWLDGGVQQATPEPHSATLSKGEGREPLGLQCEGAGLQAYRRLMWALLSHVNRCGLRDSQVMKGAGPGVTCCGPASCHAPHPPNRNPNAFAPAPLPLTHCQEMVARFCLRLYMLLPKAATLR